GLLGRARRLDDLLESRRIANRQVGENLAIERDVGLVERRDEARVRDPELTGGGVDAGDPEAAEVRLALAAVKQREAPFAMDRLYCGLPQLRAAATKPLRVLANSVPAMTCLRTTFGARHFEKLLSAL